MAAAGAQFLRGMPLNVAGLSSCCPDATRRGARRGLRSGEQRGGIVTVKSSASTTVEQVEYEKGQGAGARWAGDEPLARVVTSLLSIKPLYEAIKFSGQKVMIRTAEKSGIPWQQMVKELQESEVYTEKDLLENVNMSYPDYYTKKFHFYEKGNLSWEAEEVSGKRPQRSFEAIFVETMAAFDAGPATKVVMKRAFKDIDSPDEAERILRFRWLKEIEAHHTKYSKGLDASAILDIGCSVGVSSRFLRDYFPMAQVTGVDLSPYFLAVAQHIQKQEAAKNSPQKRDIQYLHALGEQTGLPSESYDVISYAFLLHECPQTVTSSLLREARRLIKPGGTIAFIDISPQAKVIQELHPALFVMMKATEPWLDEYVTLDLKAELERNGFTNVTTSLTSPRHATVTATAV